MRWKTVPPLRGPTRQTAARKRISGRSGRNDRSICQRAERTRRKASEKELFRADGEDLFALDLELNAKGRANVAALDDAAANPDVAGKAGSFQGIVKRAAARIADEGMSGSAKAVFCFQLFKVGDVLEMAGAVGGFARKGPITVR